MSDAPELLPETVYIPTALAISLSKPHGGRIDAKYTRADSLAENHVHLKERIAELEAEVRRKQREMDKLADDFTDMYQRAEAAEAKLAKAKAAIQEVTDYGLPMSLRIMAQARATLAAIKANVPELVWELPCAKNNWIYQAHAPWGTYGIHICGGRHQAWLEAHEKPYERWLGDGYVGSVYAAQAAAQAHHVAQLMKGLGL